MTEPIESHCARCLRPAPDDPSVEWEVVIADDGEVLVICEDCVTGEARQAMDEEDMALGDLARRPLDYPADPTGRLVSDTADPTADGDDATAIARTIGDVSDVLRRLESDPTSHGRGGRARSVRLHAGLEFRLVHPGLGPQDPAPEHESVRAAGCR